MTRRPSIARILVSAIVLLILFGVGFAWQLRNYLIARPGEDALRRFAPENAAMVVTLDIHPSSFEQGQVLHRIQAALQNEQLDRRVQLTLHKLPKSSPIVRDLLPYCTGSGAFALWARSGADDLSEDVDAVLALGISREGDAAKVLQRDADHTTRESGRTIYHVRLPDSSQDTAALLLDHYLLFGEIPALKQALKVHDGKTVSLAKDAAFTRLRKHLPADATLLCYLSAEAMRQISKQSGHDDDSSRRLLEQAQPAGWAMSLRQGGIQFDSAAGCDAESLKPLSQIASLNPSTDLRIPANTLGFLTMAQPGKYVEAFEQVIHSAGGDIARSWNDGLADSERQTHIHLHEDVLPALNGNLTLAAYAGPKPETLDLLLLLDNTHSARPAALADQVRTAITDRDNHLTFTSKERNGTTLWTLPDAWDVNSLGANVLDNPPARERVAQVDNALILATSAPLLDRSITAYRKKPEAPLDLLRLPAGSKAIFVLEPRPILDLLCPRLEELQKQHRSKEHIAAQELYDLFGNAPLIASTGYQDGYLTGSLLLPVHYETAIKITRQVWDIADREKESDQDEDNGNEKP